MAVIPVTNFEYTCQPLSKGFPIRQVIVTIVASDRDEADEMFSNYAHQFFNQDIRRSVVETRQGYIQVTDKE